MIQHIINITDTAAEQIKNLISNHEKPVLGIRISIKSGGCSGLSYSFEYAYEQKPTDEIVEDKGISIFIEQKAVIYLLGTTLDYIDQKVRSGFVFINPNEKGRCGCGSSFHV
jgi:iron-sulfur cluster assembly protein